MFTLVLVVAALVVAVVFVVVAVVFYPQDGSF